MWCKMTSVSAQQLILVLHLAITARYSSSVITALTLAHVHFQRSRNVLTTADFTTQGDKSSTHRHWVVGSSVAVTFTHSRSLCYIRTGILLI